MEERTLVINDFESDGDLDRIYWACRRLFFLSDEHATHGNRSLLMELHPAMYPGLTLKLQHTDWSSYDCVCLDFFNPETEDLDIVFRIDDRKDTSTFEDRYNRAFILSPGPNHLCISIQDLLASGSERMLNVEAISRFMFFLVDTRKVYRLYVDYIRLEKKCDLQHTESGKRISGTD